MEFQLVVSPSLDGRPFTLWVEPEGMRYELPGTGQVVLTFRGPDPMRAELTHGPDEVVIWRPGDTEVWATLPGDEAYQIAGWTDNPAPGLDSAGAPLDAPGRDLIERLLHPAVAAPKAADHSWWRRLTRLGRRRSR